MKLLLKALFDWLKKGVTIDPTAPIDSEKAKAEIVRLNAETTKFAAEAAKAEAEARDVKRSFLARYQFWVAISPLIIAFAILLISNRWGLFKLRDAQLAAERAIVQLDVRELQAKTNYLYSTIATQQLMIADQHLTISNLQASISKLQEENQAIQQSLASYSVVTNDLALAQTNFLFLLRDYARVIAISTNYLPPGVLFESNSSRRPGLPFQIIARQAKDPRRAIRTVNTERLRLVGEVPPKEQVAR